MKTALRRLFLSAALCAVGIGLAACGGGGSDSLQPTPTPTPTPTDVSSLSIEPASATDWWGYDVALNATARNAGNIIASPTLNWTSSNPSVATVSSAGLVTLNRPGTATISAETAAGVRGQATVLARGFGVLGQVKISTQCVISDDRLQILCWGYSGLLDHPMIPNRRNLYEYSQPTPIRMGDIPIGTRIKQVSTSAFHACALTEAGQAYCWGEGAWGELGSGNLSDVTAPVAVVQGQIPAGITLTNISVDNSRTCATASNGRIYCWGNDALLPVAKPLSSSAQPAPLLADLGQDAAGVNMVAVQLGGDVNRALGDNGRVYFWGTREGPGSKQLEQGDIPVNVKLVQISDGNSSSFACGLGDNGRAYCWGSASGNRFGVGDDVFRIGAPPTAVAQGDIPVGVRLVDLAVGGNAIASCGLGDDGNIYCWGSGFYGSLGNGILTKNLALTPTRVLDGERPSGVSFTQVECGRYHCTALGNDGRAYTWGYNEDVALGLPGSAGSKAQPTLVTRPNRD